MGKTRLGRRSRMFREFLGGVEPSELLIVALDIAKFQPKAAIFEYFGDIIIKPFFFTPDIRGIEMLYSLAQKALLDTGKKQVVFGVENTGHYQENIVKMLIEKGQLVLHINALSTHEERKSFLDYSKTDDIDLHAIASAVAGGKVTFTMIPSHLQGTLRYYTRTRRFLVNERSKFVVVLRTILDHYWPYIQGIPEIVEGKTKIHKVFEDLTSIVFLIFIKLIPSPQDVLRLGEQGLIQLFKENRLQIDLERCKLILNSAKLAQSIPTHGMLQHYIYYVRFYADCILQLNQEINSLEDKIESILCQTKGILLLSIQQIGVITAAEFMAEIGLELERYHSASAVIKQAGTNPVPSESAGRSGQMCISKQGNPWLRYVVSQIGKNLVRGKSPYFAAFVEHLSCRFAKQKYVATGNKFIRVAYAMLSKGELFTPKTWQGESLTVDPLGKLQSKNIVMAQNVLNSILKPS